MTTLEFIQTALLFPNTAEAPHFDRIAFKVFGRKIFATLHDENQTANIMLYVEDQQKFCAKDRSFAYPVPNKWGEKGATTFELPQAGKEIIYSALEAAYREASKPKVRKK